MIACFANALNEQHCALETFSKLEFICNLVITLKIYNYVNACY